MEVFNNKTGNCYRYASAFAYCARVLGYEPKIVIGELVGYTSHGWNEIKIDGKTYVFDPQIEVNHSRRGHKHNLFKTTYDKYNVDHMKIKPNRRLSLPK